MSDLRTVNYTFAYYDFTQNSPLSPHSHKIPFLIFLQGAVRSGGCQVRGLFFCFVYYDIQENFDKRDNLWREKVSKRDNFPCYLT
jgi:hypothetical protein